MSKDVPWFKHDMDATSDPKVASLIQIYGMEGYGRWWTIVEHLRSRDGYKMELAKWTFRAFAKSWSCTPEEAEKFIQALIGEEIELLKSGNGYAWSSRLLANMDEIADKKRRYAEAGQKGGEATASGKRSRSKAQASPQHPSSNEINKINKKGGRKNSGIPDGAAKSDPPPSSAPPFQEGILKDLSEIHQAATGKPLPEPSANLKAQLENLEVSEFPEDIREAYQFFQKKTPGKALNFFLADYFAIIQKARNARPKASPERKPGEPCPRCNKEMTPSGGPNEVETWACFTCKPARIFRRGENGKLFEEVAAALPAAPAIGPPGGVKQPERAVV